MFPSIIRGILLGVAIYVLALMFATIQMVHAQDFNSWLDACAPYRADVERILDEEHVDRSYYFLMVAESRCTDRAISPKGAAGFWQLMPSTAIHYGCLDVHDLECSTRAAARYIRHLGATFKRFDDIIAAYNMGGHNLMARGKTKQAIGLINTVHRMMQADNRRHK